MKHGCEVQEIVYLCTQLQRTIKNINIMATRKYMLCQYPSNGFGGKNGTFYLLDVFGNKYGFLDEYDKTLGEMNKIISVNGTTYCERSMDEIIKRIEMETDSKIECW